MRLNRRDFMKRAGAGTAGAVAAASVARGRVGAEVVRPNILWLTSEDMGPHLGCYGDSYAHTPNLDRFAQRALRYDVAWSNVPVCSPARTALITGVYPTSLGAHNHRSMVGLPEFMRMFPEWLRERGYYCSNNHKEDYNVPKTTGVWDESSTEAHYRTRAAGQPFFAVFNNFDSHGSSIRNRTELPHHDPDDARLPAYHPDTPTFRRDWAQYYHNISMMDTWVGGKLEELEALGLAQDTIVFYFSDHGSGMPRGKLHAYDSGLRVPLLVHVPEKYRHLAPADYKPGGATARPVSFVDMAPTVLSLLGVAAPDWMDGRAFMGQHEAEPREYVFGARGRMDERQDMVRSVRNTRYIYVRNYMPHLMPGQFCKYMYALQSTRDWRRRYEAGLLESPHDRVWHPKPAEELYDLEADPDEVNNLAGSPAHRAVRDELREALRGHIRATRDVAFLPEGEMHRRAKGTTKPVWETPDGRTIYEMARDSATYPLERIAAMAELAADRAAEAVPELTAALDDADPAIRYWAAMGILIRGASAFETAGPRVFEAVDDANPSVRIVAAEIVARYGIQADADAAVDILGQLARPVENGAYVAMQALAVIEDLGWLAQRLEPALRAMPSEDPNTPWRGANALVERLLPGYVHHEMP
jgi:arylsulfatase A-like enzyme